MTDGRIRVFAVDAGSLPALPDRALEELFPEDRAAAIRKYRMPGDRIRSAWAELLLRAVLEKHCGIPRDTQKIIRREDGKPYLAGGAGMPEISISHSGPWAAASIGPAVHGIDVEVPRKPEMYLTLADRWFLPAEAEALRNAPEEERTELFLLFWTVKESFLKMTGEGLRSGPQAADALRLLQGSDETAAFRTVLPDGAVLSCCGPGEVLPERAEIWPAEELRKLYGL